MGAILYKVPYQVTCKANDLGSGKPLSNSWYYRCADQAGPPVYGTPVVGSSNATFLAAFLAAWAGIRGLLNANYVQVSVESSAMIGKVYSTISYTIAALANSLTIVITTGVPHLYVTGSTVNVYGVTAPAGANGVWTITVVSPTQFSLDGSVPGLPWTGDGFVQLAAGTPRILLYDTTVLADTSVGGIVGDALPLYCTGSVRRLNAGIGRSFRSRVSLSPMSESQSLDGGWTAGTRTAFAAALATFASAPLANGAAIGTMFDLAVSRKLALGLATPFSQSTSWAATVSSYLLQRSSGSLTRRKPRLSSVIV